MKKINILDYGAKGRNAIFDTIALQRALNQAKKEPVEVYVPKGTYYICKELVIYGHTYLHLHPDAVLRRMSPFAMLKNGKKSVGYKGYDGNGFIKIEGGTFDQYGHVLNFNNSIMSLGHAREIEIKDVTLKNVVQGHAIDACGIDGFKVTGCKFLGFRDDSGKRAFSEAIQLDLQLKDSFPKFGEYDGTVTKNVIIENCYFGNSDDPLMKPWNRAIGSHASTYEIYYENITVKHNTFEQMGDYALTFLKSKVLHIHDNTFNDCNGGIRYLATKQGKYSVDLNGVDHGVQAGEMTLIRRNQFHSINDKYAILFQSYEGEKNKDIYIIDNQFSEDHTCTIKIGKAKNVVCIKNKNLKKIKQVEVDDFYTEDIAEEESALEL
ncbi:glycosyl hydrolase family 28-related protein [Macrococcoides caseolyticum]|uniref:glycosyl hydrolase family 28-related protein n=1 Tax=Macrococcoides caseolyticum TaxID=69966 RepID=UPI001F45BC45|nr:glycosyl hydrolase family 28-related protein [Macrococcus caseolyticus]MCE4957454.1 right-handed parallel beta-helix repeat-containing protein [Macrococcus caseolyticus]